MTYYAHSANAEGRSEPLAEQLKKVAAQAACRVGGLKSEST